MGFKKSNNPVLHYLFTLLEESNEQKNLAIHNSTCC